MDKTGLYLMYFIVYSLIMLVIGKNSLRGENTPRDYFICGKKVPLLFCVATFTGTWVSAITILSLTGSIYEDGLPVLFYSVIPWFFGAFLMGLAAGKLYETRAITVPEMLRERYGSRNLQMIGGIILICVYIFYLVAQYKGFGMIASELFDIPYPLAVLLVYLFILYTTLGGYRSVIRTDLMNLVFLLGSLFLVCFSLVGKAGGFAELYHRTALIEGLARPGAVSPTEKGQMLHLFGGRFTPMNSLSMFWGWGLGLSANAQYIVRLMSAEDKKTARRVVPVSLGILALIYLFLIHIGLAMRVLVPAIPDPVSTDGIFIRLINHELYGPLSALFFFSVIGACISTANSQLLLVASSFAYDILRAAKKEELTGHQTVRIARYTVVAAGTLSMILTLNPPAFTLSYGGDIWGIVGIFMFPLLYLPLVRKGITVRGAWHCVITGALAAAITYPLYYAGVLKIHPALPSIICSSVALLAGSGRNPKNLLPEERGDSDGG